MTFLTAEWRKLLMVNYEVSPELLAPYVPWGTELDLWQGRCYISLVGFMFIKTRVLGLPIPFHRDFEEVNLRFYVRRKDPGSAQAPRRGVVFIQEIVPKPAITLIANGVYGENYATHRMRHQWDLQPDCFRVNYEWKPFFGPAWYKMAAETEPVALPIAVGSEEEFITEHYWGYASLGARSTNEYQVEHPRWNVYQVRNHQVKADFGKLYGPAFRDVLKGAPTSVFVAEGSAISILGKSKIT